MVDGPLAPVATLSVREGDRAPQVGQILQVVAPTSEGITQAEWLAGGVARWTVSAVQAPGANYTAAAFELVRYIAAEATQISAPPNPVVGDRFGAKNVSDNLNFTQILGNGNNLESPQNTFALGSPIFLAGDSVAGEWIYSGTEWLAI